MQLISLIILVCILYYLAPHYPFAAGVLACLPIKIIAVFLSADNILKATEGMLVGGTTVLFLLILIYGYLKWV